MSKRFLTEAGIMERDMLSLLELSVGVLNMEMDITAMLLMKRLVKDMVLMTS